MSLGALQEHAKSMGFEVALRSKYDEAGACMPDLTPPPGRGWVLAGTYAHLAGFWVRPLDIGRKVDGELVRRLLADCDLYIGAIETPGADFFDEAPALPASPALGERLHGSHSSHGSHPHAVPHTGHTTGHTIASRIANVTD